MKELLKVPTVRKFLLEAPTLFEFSRIFEGYGLSKDRASEALDLSNAVIDGTLPPEETPHLIAQAFGIEDTLAKKVAADILGWGVLPLENFFPKIAEVIISFGGNIADYPGMRVPKEQMTSLMAAERFSREANIAFSDVLLKRFAFLLEGLGKGQKDMEGLRTFFGRALTIGGLGLVKEQNDALMAVIGSEFPFVGLVSPEEYANIEAQKKAEEEKTIEDESEEFEDEAPLVTLPEIAPSHEIAATVPVPIKKPTAVSEEKPEADAKVKAENIAEDHGARLRRAFEEALAATLEDAEPLLKRNKMDVKVFADIAGKAIRGVRDIRKTRDLLEAEHGVKVDESMLFMEILQKGTKKYADAAKLVSTNEVISPEVAEAIEEGEALLMNKRFAALTHDAPGAPLEPVLPGARVSAARSSAEEMAKRQAAVTAEVRDEALKAERPKPAKAELTVGSMPPERGEVKKIADVVAPPRLLGPVEQLKAIGPTEFRRLSSNPDEAAQKIEDMVGALEGVSYDERVKGIRAWRVSPMNALYLAITEESLNTGVSIPEISTKRRSQGRESLSPAEIKAIVALNARLRF